MFSFGSNWAKRVTQAAGLSVSALAVAVLVGWYIHFVPLIQVLPALAPMQRMTAVGFLLSGIALVLLSTGRKRAAGVCGLAVFVLASAVCLEYALDADFGIDQLLGRDYINVRTSNPGRTSPVTALCLIGGSVALLVTASRRLARFASGIVGILASMLMTVGTVSVLGYLLGHTGTYGWGHFTRMALHSSAAFALLGAGLLAWAWQESRARQGAPEWLPLSIGLGLAAGVLGVWQALIAHEEGDLPLLSGIILAGGLLGALLVAIAVAQAQKARQRSRELQESEARLQLQISRMPIACIVFSKELRILSWNPAAELIFGFSAKEVVGRHAYDCIVPPDLQPQVDSVIARLVEGDETAHSTNENLTKDGRRIICEWTNTPLRGADGTVYGILSMTQDITARKQAEDALRESEERFRKVFEQGPIGVALMGIGGRFFKVNASFCRMLGYSEAELTSMTPLDVTHPEDREVSADLMESIFHSDFTVGKLEKRYVKKNGEIVWGNLTTSALRDREGRPLYTLGMIEDITERRHAEAELRLGSEIFANMEEGVCLIRLDDATIVHANPKFEKMFGYSPDKLTGIHIAVINAPAYKHPEEAAEEIREEVMRSGVWRGEILHQRKDGTPFWCSVTVSMFHHPEFGKVGVSIHQDITDLKKAQETLRESEERFRGIFEQGPIGVALLGLDHRMTKVNPAFRRMLGYSEAELARMTPLDMTHPDDRDACMRLLERLDKGETPVCRMEKRYLKKNGEIMWASLTASVIRDQHGRPLHGLGMVEDITERRQSEQKLAEQAALLDLARDSIAVRDLEGRFIFWNRGAKDTYGWSAEEALGCMAQELLQSRYPIPLKEIEATVLKQGVWEGELEQTTRDGKRIVVASRWSLWRDELGAPRAILVINRDITARKHDEEQLRNLTERLSLATRTASIGIWDWDLRTNQLVWDETLFNTFGIPKAVPMAYEEFARRVHPGDLPAVEASVQKVVRGKTQDFVEFRIIRPDGTLRHMTSAAGAVMDEQGNVVRVVGTGVDITKRKEMEAQIEANKVQLVASARLSALGMMAGNVAHEINNPVGIIHALASDLIDMVKEEGAAPPEMVARNSASIRETADRIARITKSLRQISREGSRDKFYATRVGKMVEETLEICRERFRANAVKLLLPEKMPELNVACREVQIEQILLNLLQNAFDAVVEQPGERWVRLDVGPLDDSVVISVTDSGPGIPAELRPHIMEPFFTTKPVGKGTGLGLSLSKTIAEEHGGGLEYSEDHGHTRFSLVLPMAREAEAVWT